MLLHVAATAALNTGKVSLDDEFNCEVGKFEFDGWTISDHEKFGVLTFPQIIANSSNVGVIKIAQIIGKELFANDLGDFYYANIT